MQNPRKLEPSKCIVCRKEIKDGEDIGAGHIFSAALLRIFTTYSRMCGEGSCTTVGLPKITVHSKCDKKTDNKHALIGFLALVDIPFHYEVIKPILSTVNTKHECARSASRIEKCLYNHIKNRFEIGNNGNYFFHDEMFDELEDELKWFVIYLHFATTHHMIDYETSEISWTLSRDPCLGNTGSKMWKVGGYEKFVKMVLTHPNTLKSDVVRAGNIPFGSWVTCPTENNDAVIVLLGLYTTFFAIRLSAKTANDTQYLP